MTFDGGVEYREDAAKGAGQRTARARTLKATLAPTAAPLTKPVFGGGFRFEEGRLIATSVDATYQVTKGALALRGGPGATRPHVEDERVSVDGNTIDVTLTPRQMNGRGAVHTELAAGRRKAGERGTTLLDRERSRRHQRRKPACSTRRPRQRCLQGQGASLPGERHDHPRRRDHDGREAGNADSDRQHALGAAHPRPAGAESPRSRRSRAPGFRVRRRQAPSVLTKQAQLDGAQGNLQAGRIEMFLGRDGQYARSARGAGGGRSRARQAHGNRPAPDLSSSGRNVRADRRAGASCGGLSGIHRPYR